MDDSVRPRQAACLVCRRSKIKCDWKDQQERCRRCIQLDCECIRPAYHPGRQKGIKKSVFFTDPSVSESVLTADSKRTGLDKALYQIDQVIKRTRSAEQHTAEDERVLQHLRDLLNGTSQEGSSSVSPSQAEYAARPVPVEGEEEYFSGEDVEGEDEADPDSMPDFIKRTEESLAIDDAENPLQLLARASYIQPSPESRHGFSPQQLPLPSGRTQLQPEDEIQAFFAPAQAKLDVGDDVDPVTLGLVTDEEAQSLFNLQVHHHS